MDFTSTTRLYIDQYIKTAGAGNISVMWAEKIARVRFMCKVCNITLTTGIPKECELDYSLQGFVKLHSHVGGHNDISSGVCEKCGGIATGHKPECPCIKKVTLDFKPLGPSPLPPFKGPMNYKDYVNCTDYTFTSNNTNATVHIPTRAELEAMLVLYNEDLQNAEKREAKPNKHRLKTLKTATGRRFR